MLTPTGAVEGSVFTAFPLSEREERNGTADRRVDGGGRLELKFVQERERFSLLGSQSMFA
jgi:hypothetical protein